MNIDLTDEETAALLRELDGIIASDRYFLSPRVQTLRAIRNKIRRVQTLRAIRNKIRPAPPLKALPPLKHYEPPRVGRRRRG